MAPPLFGRYGTYKPRSDVERARARKQAQGRSEVAASRAAWLQKHQFCANGCGRPTAFWDTIHYSLRYSGACSAECQTELQTRGTNDGILSEEDPKCP